MYFTIEKKTTLPYKWTLKECKRITRKSQKSKNTVHTQREPYQRIEIYLTTPFTTAEKN